MKEKPVLWQWLDTAQVRKKVPDCFIKSDWRPLYKKPQTKPLSEETIEELREYHGINDWMYETSIVDFVRAVEKAHGIQ